MSVPNTTPGTAVDITLPWVLSIDISPTNIPTAAWYSFTSAAFCYLLAMQVANNHTYFPFMQLYNSDGTTPTDPGNLIADWEDPNNQPVDPNTRYYIKVEGDSGAPDSTLAVFTVLANPNLDAVAGSFIIPNDETGTAFPALLLSAAGAVLRAVPGANGQRGDILASGVSCCDTNTQSLQLRDTSSPSFALVTAVSPFGAGSDSIAISSDHASSFYVASTAAGSFTVKTVSSTGTIGGTSWVPGHTDLNFMAVVPGAGTLYYTTTGIADAVRSYNLSGSSDNASFVAGTADYRGNVILTLADSTVVILYQHSSDRSLDFVRHYSALGATLQSFDPASSCLIDYIARNGTSTTDIWLWNQSLPVNASLTSTFQRVQLSDGAVLETFTIYNYNAGIPYDEAAAANPFGPSPSCPMLIMTVDSPIAIVPPVIGTVTTRKMRRVRRAPHLWDGEVGARIFYPGFQLLVETGADRPDLTTIARYALRWSDDGGFTWSNEYWVDAGTIGQYKLRALWRRLGYSRDRIFEVIDDFDGKSTILDALLVPDPIQGAG